MEKKIKIGSIVYSKAGRDKGRYFVVTGMEGEYIYMVDGCLRKISRPKKKKVKHVEPKPFQAKEISEERLLNREVLDSEIRKCLASMGTSEKKEG